ncbi:Hypothetical predicted protein [Mytilus galloprovincialis]|uniref:OTU domain-containing protein n=1 Tax=Mytilus galloprovincialis TaxID=29158 RepID=A0A8B6DHM9_MYTGA|nr:Hypothetical predicted protein [Mytilus galloprovincialis]
MARKSKKSKSVKAKEQRERMRIRRETIKNDTLENVKDLNQDMQDEKVGVLEKEFIKNNFNDVTEALGSSPLVKNLEMETSIEISKLDYDKKSIIKNLNTDMEKNLEVTNKNKKSDSKLNKTFNLNLDEKLDLKMDEQLDLDLDEQLDLNLDEQLDLNLDEQLDLNLDEQLDLKMDEKLDLNLELNLDKKSDLNSDKQSAFDLDEQSDINLDNQLDLNLDNQLDLNLDFNLDKHLELNLDRHSDLNFDKKEANRMSDFQFYSNCNKQFHEFDSNLIIGQDKITSLNKNTCQDNRSTSHFIDSIGVSRSAVGNKVVQGSFHQGDRRFGINSGKQCVANCLSALAHSKSKDLNYWNQMYLDTVLIAGNRLYSHIHGNNDHLFISDLPEMVEISGKVVKILRKESITAVIDSSRTIDFSEFGNSLPLDQALQESLIDCDACFICAYDTTVVVIKHNQDFYLFDSHARDKFGLQHNDGKSLLLKLNNLDHLYQYCCNMKAGASQNQWFETTGVNIDFLGEDPRQQSFVELPHVPRDDNHLMKVYDNKPEIRNINASNEVPKNRSGMPKISSQLHVLHSEDFKENSYNITMKIDDTKSDVVITDNESDVEILSAGDIIYDFKPLSLVLKRKLCTIMRITTKHIFKPFSTNIFQMGPPSATKTITGDGNCLFRAISYAISNRQEFFQTIRKAIVVHLMRNEDMFKSFLQPRFKTVREHLQTLKMDQYGVWGTELEIIACADLLKTDIFTFYHGSWIRYSSTQICSKNNVNILAIYLKHDSNINHYEVVTAVTPMSDLSFNRLQSESSKVHRKRHMLERRPAVRTKKINVEESQITDIDNQCDDSYLKSKAGKQKRKYHSDTSFKEKKKTQVQNAYWENEETRLKKIQSGKEKYKNDQVYREHLIDAGVKKYRENDDYREKLIQTGVSKYKTDEVYREKLIQTGVLVNIKPDEVYREKLIQTGVSKYKTDEVYREKLIQTGVSKYKTDEVYREKLIQTGVSKYKIDEVYREKLIQTGVSKYKTDEVYREKLKLESKHRYENDNTHKLNIIKQTATRREKSKEENKQINEVIRKFKEEVEKGPECVCACCLRLFFEKQVLNCKIDSYDDSLKELCITDRYQHKCTDDCEKPCGFEGTSRTSLWICYTCHRKILRGKIPADSFSNGLLLEDVPVELKQLNSIEQQLIAQNIPFMKIMALPKGGQKGVHGPVVCVPSDLKKVTSILPRSEDESLLLKVKLKRKLKYKEYDKYQFVRPNHLEQALLYLKDKNMWYKDVAINNQWINPIPGSNDDQDMNEKSDSDDTELVENSKKEKDVIEKIIKSSTTSNEREDESEQDSYIDDRLRGVQLDTCLQPADIGQEALDLCFDQVFNVAPAENNSPLSVLQEQGIEAKTFPVHFPSGKNTFDEDRDDKLTIAQYSKLRLMSVENRFARDTSYIFFSQYLTELNSVISNVQISLRKECPFSKEGKKVTGEMLCNKETLKELFKKDEAIKYLKPIRGTPPYWQSSQKDIFAMIRQLGVPTFFCSFSSADFRWSEIVDTILKQQGDMRNSENMTWDEKCKVLSSNPVTAARMFDHRYHTFLKDVIMSDAEPIGKVIDYFYRVEFQQRGSPHTHCLFWVENAPKFDEDENEEVISFIDKYITCEIPDEKEDKELHDIVMAVHQHSKNHSKSCKKKGTVCRFNFPRPPSTRTFISKPSNLDKDSKEDEEVAKKILSDLWKVIKENEDKSLNVSEIFKKAGLTQESFEKYFCFITNRNTVVLKRQPNELYTNQYNPHLLELGMQTWTYNIFWMHFPVLYT